MAKHQVEEWIEKYSFDSDDAQKLRDIVYSAISAEGTMPDVKEETITLDAKQAQNNLTNKAMYFDASTVAGKITQTVLRPSETKGKNIGRYEDLGLLGYGAMGEVRRVKDPILKRTLAIKILHQHLLKQPTTIARFIEEAQISAQLQHPNIVPLYELGKLSDGRVYFTMKEIKGNELKEIIRDLHRTSNQQQWRVPSSGWSLFDVMNAFLTICEAVAYAHSKGVIHRDLKPKNIMLDNFGSVLLVDWGLAKVSKPTSEKEGYVPTEPVIQTARTNNQSHTSQFGQIAGTPAYMSPEQAAGQNSKIDERSDIYSLGAILYEILSGEAPFHGFTPSQIIDKIRDGTSLNLRNRNSLLTTREFFAFEARKKQESGKNPKGPPLPEYLVNICEKALARDPENRFQTATEMANRLRSWLDVEQDMRRELIKQVVFLRNAKEELIEELAASLVQEHFSNGDIVFNEGDFGKDFWIIGSGKVLIKNGEEEIAELGSGDWFGEGALLSTHSRSATAIASEEALLYRMKGSSFHYLIKNYPTMQASVRTIYKSRRLKQLQLKIRQELLQQVPLFASIRKEILRKFVHVLRRVEHKGVLFKQGDSGDEFFVIASGRIHLVRNGTLLTELIPGSYFGEGALIESSVRTATAIATEKAILYKLQRREFERLLSRYPEVKKHIFKTHKERTEVFVQEVLKNQMLCGVSFFQKAPAELLKDLSSKLNPKVIDKGEVVFDEGNSGKEMFLVSSGSVGIYRKQTKIAEITSGSCFGEMALLSNHPRSARVIALERTQLLCLNKGDFTAVLNKWPDFSEFIQELIDARVK